MQYNQCMLNTVIHNCDCVSSMFSDRLLLLLAYMLHTPSLYLSKPQMCFSVKAQSTITHYLVRVIFTNVVCILK